jgi:glucose-1-phosphate adenylyltransferase
MVAEGSLVDGCTVDRAVIGIGTRARGATIRNSLIMGADTKLWMEDDPDRVPVGIGAGTVIEGAIVDRNVRIGRGVRIVNEAGLQEADGDGWSIRDGIVVVQRNAEIPDGTVV